MTEFTNQNINWSDLFPYLELIDKGEPLKISWTAPTCINNYNKSQILDIAIKTEKTEDNKIRKDFSEFDFEDDSTANSGINLMRKNKTAKPKIKQYKTNMDKILKDLMRKKIEEKDEANASRISTNSNDSNLNSDLNINNMYLSHDEEEILNDTQILTNT